MRGFKNTLSIQELEVTARGELILLSWQRTIVTRLGIRIIAASTHHVQHTELRKQGNQVR